MSRRKETFIGGQIPKLYFADLEHNIFVGHTIEKWQVGFTNPEVHINCIGVMGHPVMYWINIVDETILFMPAYHPQ